MNFEKEWIKHFTKDVSKKDLDFRVRDSGNFIWHAFLDLIDKGSYLVGNEARKTFDKVNKVGPIYFSLGMKIKFLKITLKKLLQTCSIDMTRYILSLPIGHGQI